MPHSQASTSSRFSLGPAITSSMVSSLNFRSSSMVTWSLILNKRTGAAKSREAAKHPQVAPKIVSYGVLMPSNRQKTAAPALWIPGRTLIALI